MDANESFPLARLRFRHVFIFQNIKVAKFMDSYCFHGCHNSLPFQKLEVRTREPGDFLKDATGTAPALCSCRVWDRAASLIRHQKAFRPRPKLRYLRVALRWISVPASAFDTGQPDLALFASS